ncbi:MAG: hypothetical protein ACC650_04140 [Gammaproteobacteria bacterium]
MVQVENRTALLLEAMALIADNTPIGSKFSALSGCLLQMISAEDDGS